MCVSACVYVCGCERACAFSHCVPYGMRVSNFSPLPNPCALKMNIFAWIKKKKKRKKVYAHNNLSSIDSSRGMVYIRAITVNVKGEKGNTRCRNTRRKRTRTMHVFTRPPKRRRNRHGHAYTTVQHFRQPPASAPLPSQPPLVSHLPLPPPSPLPPTPPPATSTGCP